MQEKLKEPRVYMCIAFFLTLILPWMKVESKAEGVDAMGASMNGLTVFLTQLSVFCWGCVGNYPDNCAVSYR